MQTVEWVVALLILAVALALLPRTIRAARRSSKGKGGLRQENADGSDI